LLFNSGTFAIFLCTLYLVYWSIPTDRIRTRNLLILLASYLFYGWWDWRFLILIWISTAVDYLVGRGLSLTETRRSRRLLLAVSLVVNIGILGYFKYVDFFIQSFADLLGVFGLEAHPATLNLILPVGISFYTFQTLSYTIDVFRKHIEPTDDWVAFAAFVAFFPQLVAGPVERAKNLLPQFDQPSSFSNEDAKDGLRQILWGLFKKVVVADNLAVFVDAIYASYDAQPPLALCLGAVYFMVQIYCDFSGYSDIAIGTARLFGFRLSDNFRYPFFSRGMVEYKQRWHITLYTWFRDYVFMPMAFRGRRTHKFRLATAVLLNAALIGLWHGPNWTFVMWSLLHALVFLPNIFVKKRRKRKKHRETLLPSPTYLVTMAITLSWSSFAGIFFRAPTLTDAMGYIGHAIAGPWLTLPAHKSGLVFIAVLLTSEWFQRDKRHTLAVGHLPRSLRWTIYYTVCLAIILTGSTRHVPYYYFQF